MALVCGRVAALALLCACAALRSVDAAREDAKTELTLNAAISEFENVWGAFQSSLADLVQRGITLAVLEKELPYDASTESQASRKTMFDEARNGNELPSLAQIDKVVCGKLRITDKGSVSTVLTRAYGFAQKHGQGQDMKTVVGKDVTMESRDANLTMVSRKEFRVILECTHEYVKIYQDFKQIDENSDGSLDVTEVKRVQDKGMVSKLMSLSHYDANGGGVIRFDVFTAYMIAKGSPETDGE